MKGVLCFLVFLVKLFQYPCRRNLRSGLNYGKQSIVNVFSTYLTRLCRSDYKREGKLPFSLCFLCLKKRKGVLGDFGELFQSRLQSNKWCYLKHEKQSIGNVFPNTSQEFAGSTINGKVNFHFLVFSLFKKK